MKSSCILVRQIPSFLMIFNGYSKVFLTYIFLVVVSAKVDYI